MDHATRYIHAIPALHEAIGVACGEEIIRCPIELRPIREYVKAIHARALIRGGRWCDLSTTERILLRFVWEAVHRTTCPLPLHP